ASIVGRSAAPAESLPRPRIASRQAGMTLCYFETLEATCFLIPMKISTGQVRFSASDLSNHLACRHLTTLDLEVARGRRAEPDWAAPDLKVIQELGLRHEAAYL